MPDYSKGKIYKILNNIDDEFYIGSAVETIGQRMAKHRSGATRYSNLKVHNHMRNIGIDNFYIELIESYPCNSKEELNSKEGQYIREFGTLNMAVAGRTQSQYRQELKEDISERLKEKRSNNLQFFRERERTYRNSDLEKRREQQRNSYQTNREHILDKQSTVLCVCECGIEVKKHRISRHLKTQKHKQLLEQQ